MNVNPLEKIVFILRQSPDWETLAADYEAGITIDERRYKPPVYIPAFPENISRHIADWNALFGVNFFRCRKILKDIAAINLEKIGNSVVIHANQVEEYIYLYRDINYGVFYLDDDDWFSPYVLNDLENIVSLDDKITIFPLVRFDINSYTFVPVDQKASIILNERRNFNHKFHTNNYLIGKKVFLSSNPAQLSDHIIASKYADELNIATQYHDKIISATNKSPCSASKLSKISSNKIIFVNSVIEYVSNMIKLELPTEIGWCQSGVQSTVALFQRVINSCYMNDE